MASLWARASILLRDKGGNICKVIVLVAAAALDPSGGAVAALRAAIVAITKSLSSRAETGTQAGPAGLDVAGSGDYRDIEDKAVLTFRGDDNSTYNYMLPSPKDLVFVAGSDQVDADQPDVDAFVSWIEDNCQGSFGQALVFVKGERTRKKPLVD